MKKILLVLLLCTFFASIASAQIPFTPVDTNFATKTIVLPTGFGYSTLLIGGVDSVALANGTKQLSKESQDLIIYLPKNGSSTEGTLYVGHETSGSDAARGNGGGATIMNIKKGPYEWAVIGDRKKVDFSVVGGTSNNCAGNIAPKGTVFSAEESAPSSNASLGWGSDTADFGGYKRFLNNGFMVEVDANNNKVLQKCYAMGRFAHEGCAFMPDRKTAYLTEDATPACLFKFVADNVDDYTTGQLYAYKQSLDGLSGTWLPIPRQRDSINITKTIALRLGATMFIRLEDCEMGPDGNIYIAETGSDNANLTTNELAGNKPALHLEPFRKPATSSILDTFGRILKLDPVSGQITNFLQGGRGADGITCVSNPDNIAFDFKRNLMAFHEDINGTTAGRSLRNLTTCENYYIDMSIANPTVNDAKRFFVCPTGGEATGIFFTPDFETYFVNIQHPSTSDFFPFSKATTIAINKSPIKMTYNELKSPPLVGITSTGTTPNIPVYYGAFSGLTPIPGVANGFMSLTDRGPNIDADNINGGNAAGLFLFSSFNPVIYELRLEADSVRIVSMKPLRTPTGGAVSGLPLPAAPGNTPDVFFLDTSKTPAPIDNYGIDCEGIVPGINNDWLISEEYGPSIWSVDKTTGNLRWRYTPYPIAGPEIMIDTVFKRRRPNRGFEALGQTPRGRIITILQSPAYNPTSSAGDASQIHRIIEIDQKTGATRQFAYLHQAKTGNLREKDWKIGDIAAINDYEFLIIEHALRNGEDSKKIYKFDIRNATQITTDNFGGKTLEQLVDAKGLASFGIKPVEKTLVMDLLANGWDPKLEKPEGLSIVNDSTLAVCNDNDFGIISPNVDGLVALTGVPSRIYTFTLAPDQKIKDLIRIDTRINPRLAISPSILKTDSIMLGLKACRTITLTNPGSNPVRITKQYFSSNDGDFSFTPLTGKDTLLNPGDIRTIEVCFNPLQRGMRVGRITFKTDLPLTYETPRQDTSTISIDLQGTGTPVGKLAGPFIFKRDSAVVGTEVCHLDTVYNTGTEYINIKTVGVSGPDAGDFTVTGLSSTTTIAPSKFAVFTVCGRPSAEGARLGKLDITATTSGKLISTNIVFGLYGLKACATVTPQFLFVEKKINLGSSDTQRIEVKNCGEAPAIYTITIKNDTTNAYSVLGAKTTGVIAPSQSAFFPVRFAPTVKSNATAIAQITSAGVSPMNVNLNGSVASIKVIVSAPLVPPTPLGKTSNEFDVILSNVGNVAITPGVPTITGPFVYRSGATQVIAPGADGKLQFAFAPNAVGSNDGSISFAQTVPTLAERLNINLSGMGTSVAGVGDNTNQSATLTLEANYPNPFSGQTTFSYEIGKESFVELTVMSLEGNAISRVVTKREPAGKHSVTFDASHLASGVYIYSLKTEYGTISKQMNIVK